MDIGENLKGFVLGSVPTLFYIPEFVSDGEADLLINNIYQAPASKWKSLKNRRLQNWGGVVHEKGLLAQDLPPWLTRITGKISDKSRLFPSAINHVLINEYLPKQGIMPHQDGPAYFPVVAILSLGSPVVMDFTPHSSLGECRHVEDGIKLDERLDDERPFSVVLMPRSLLIFKDKAYSDYLHGIRDCEMQYYDRAVNATETSKHDAGNQWRPGLEKSNEVRAEDINSFCRTTTRVSLTCRVVSKVYKKLFKF